VDNEKTSISLFLFSHESSITNKKIDGGVVYGKKRYLKSLKALQDKFFKGVLKVSDKKFLIK